MACSLSRKTQISIGFHPVWSEPSLVAWRRLGSLATHWAHSEDSDQTGWMAMLIWVAFIRTFILLDLSWYGSNITPIQIFWKTLPPKKWKFSDKNSDILHISAQNIDCGCSTSTHNLCFWAEIRKIMHIPVNPSFTILKWCFRGSKLYRYVFVIGSNIKSFVFSLHIGTPKLLTTVMLKFEQAHNNYL